MQDLAWCITGGVHLHREGSKKMDGVNEPPKLSSESARTMALHALNAFCIPCTQRRRLRLRLRRETPPEANISFTRCIVRSSSAASRRAGCGDAPRLSREPER